MKPTFAQLAQSEAAAWDLYRAEKAGAESLAAQLRAAQAERDALRAERDEALSHLRQVERLRLFVDAYDGRAFDKEVMTSILDTAKRIASREKPNGEEHGS